MLLFVVGLLGISSSVCVLGVVVVVSWWVLLLMNGWCSIMMRRCSLGCMVLFGLSVVL